MKKLLVFMAICSFVIADFRADLQKDVKNIQKTLPTQLNANVELMDVSLKNNSAKYVYRLLKFDINKVSEPEIEKFKAQSKNLAGMIVCSNEQTKSIINEGITIVYIYKDVNKELVNIVKVKQEDCKKIDQIVKQLNTK